MPKSGEVISSQDVTFDEEIVPEISDTCTRESMISFEMKELEAESLIMISKMIIRKTVATLQLMAMTEIISVEINLERQEMELSIMPKLTRIRKAMTAGM